MRKPSILMVVLLVLVLALSAQTAFADQVYHAAHIPFMPVGGATLRSGFVENIHANGPTIYAHEVYVLNGAMPNTTFQVTLNGYLTTACSASETPAQFPTATLLTNAAGNAKGQAFFHPSDIDALGLHGKTIHGTWTLTKAGDSAPSYITRCETIHLD